MLGERRVGILMFLMNESIGGTATYLFTLMKYINANRFDVQIVCNNREFCQLATTHRFKAHILEKTGRGRYLKAILCISELIRKNSIDILNIHDGGAVSLIGRLGALIAGCISVNTVHVCAGEWGDRSKFFALKEKVLEYITRPLAKKYIAVSNARKAELISKGVRACDIHVISNGVDYKDFCSFRQKGTFRKELRVGKSIPLVALVGHLGIEKGHVYFMEAVKILLKSIRDIHFAIVGDGYLRNELVEMSRDFKVDEYVSFTGFRTDIANIMSSIDILAVPSINEGMPLVILEAMAASKPVVATNVGGIPEVVEHGKTGYLVPPRNPYKLAAAMEALIKSPELARSFGRAGFERIKGHFTANRMARETEELYEHLI